MQEASKPFLIWEKAAGEKEVGRGGAWWKIKFPGLPPHRPAGSETR